MKFKIEGPEGEPIAEGRKISVLADDGREAFSLRVGEDGRSLHIHGVDTFKAGGKLYGSRLLVQPGATNAVIVFARAYED